MRLGALTICDSLDHYWISFPGARCFVKALLSGRKKLLTTLRKAKYQQLLESDVMHRGLPHNQHISMEFHVLDAIGRGLVLRYTV